jgi:hypothetical protein
VPWTPTRDAFGRGVPQCIPIPALHAQDPVQAAPVRAEGSSFHRPIARLFADRSGFSPPSLRLSCDSTCTPGWNCLSSQKLGGKPSYLQGYGAESPSYEFLNRFLTEISHSLHRPLPVPSL